MTQKTIKTLINEFFSQPLEKKTNKQTDVYHIDDIWSLHMLDLNDYGEETNRGCRYVPVIIDKFSNFSRTNLLKKCSNNKTFY